MRILFLTHYFPPEGNAPASRTYEHCVRWALAGHDVTVITCAPNVPNGVVYDGYKNRVTSHTEYIDGIRVIRVWTFLAANAGSLKRILNYVSYMVSACLEAVQLRRADVVIATSPQFFCGWAGVLVSRICRIPFVLEVRDIWPESIKTVGAMKNSILLATLGKMEKWMYRSAHQIVTVGEGYRENIGSKIDENVRISVVTNGVDLDHFSPTEPDGDFLKEWNLEGKFVCSYVGTIGMAHGLDVVVHAAKLLQQRNRQDVVFCLIGDGAEREQLEQLAQKMGVSDLVVFTGRQSKQRIPQILASSDTVLVHLKKCELFQSVIPSKIFEAMAMQRPIVMGVEGESRQIVRRANAAIDTEPDCPESLATAVMNLVEDQELCEQLGKNGRAFVQQHYSRNVLAERMLEVVKETAKPNPCPQVAPSNR